MARRAALRRLITIPTYVLLLGLALASAPLWIPALALVDWRRSDGPRAALRCGFFFTWYLLCECAGIAASALLWLAKPLPGVGGARFLDWNRSLQSWWAATLWKGSQVIFRMRLEVEGAEEARRPPLLLFIRHASVADTLLPALLVSMPHGIRLRYVLKRELLWDPCLDIVGNRLPNYFVDRYSDDSETEIRGVARLVQDLGPDDGILIYPEGTRFTPEKREKIIARLSEAGDPALLDRAKHLEHTLPPRLGGTLALLDANPGADIVFCAHSGFEGAGTFWDLWNGALVDTLVRVRFWRVPWTDVPDGRDDRIAWLFHEWSRIDRWLAGD